MRSIECGNWLIRYRPRREARLRLFCFPYAGGSASFFRNWPERLGHLGIEIGAVQLPGREHRLREVPIRRMKFLLGELTRALSPALERPFAFFGHSLGALVAYEFTRHLRRNGGPQPEGLLLSGHRAPHWAPTREPLHLLPDGELIERLRAFNGTPEEILGQRELLELILPVIRADFELHETYVYQPEALLDCEMAIFGGREDPDVELESLKAWKEQTTGAWSLHVGPGDHFYLNRSQGFWEALEAELRRLN